MKPILFSPELVRAILDGRKSVTRRVVKFPEGLTGSHAVGEAGNPDNPLGLLWAGGIKRPPYNPGQILYVRETWCQYGKLNDYDQLIEGTEEYYYRADGENPTPFNDFLVQHPGWDEHRETPVWHPSIHMPREAARLFLWVKDVRVERLQEITEEQAILEGIEKRAVPVINASNVFEHCIPGTHNVCISGRGAFSHLWDSTIKKANLSRYGWDGNPWCWVIEFKKISKEEALENA